MEKIKALLAVALFVAGLIFGIPSINPKAEFNSLSKNEKNQQASLITDTIPKTLYIIQPEINSDLAERHE